MQNTLNLSIPIRNSKSIELHTNNDKNVELDRMKNDNFFPVLSQSINLIKLRTKTFSAEEVKFVVNAVGKSIKCL